MVPKKDTSETLEKRAERKIAMTTPNPANKHLDLGKLIFPSKNLAKLQKIIHRVSPITKSNPLEVSIGILVKGKKKNGSNTTTKNNDKKESLLNICDCISFIISRSETFCKVLLQDYTIIKKNKL